jgi:hypothetical protein
MARKQKSDSLDAALDSVLGDEQEEAKATYRVEEFVVCTDQEAEEFNKPRKGETKVGIGRHYTATRPGERVVRLVKVEGDDGFNTGLQSQGSVQ